MKNLYYWFKTVDQVAIPITIRLELLCFVFEEIKDRTGGVAILEDLRRGMCSKVYAYLFGIVGQRSIENGLKVRRVRGRRHWWLAEGIMTTPPGRTREQTPQVVSRSSLIESSSYCDMTYRLLRIKALVRIQSGALHCLASI